MPNRPRDSMADCDVINRVAIHPDEAIINFSSSVDYR